MPPLISRDVGSTNRKSGYLPSLDGWRAIAILGVMWTHDLKWRIAGHSLKPFQDQGGLGVSLFFAISGILITSRILEEESICGYFDIKKFYIRRFFRIQPAQWVYLALIGCLTLAGSLTLPWRYWFGALGMYENFIYPGLALNYRSFFVGHFWSLAVEEHFYVLLSLFLLTVRRNRLLLLVVIFAGLVVFETHAGNAGRITDVTGRRTYYQLDTLVYGACLATALRRQTFRYWAEQILRPWIVFSITLGWIVGRGVIYHLLRPGPHDFMPHVWLGALGFIRTYLFAIWIVATMLHGNSLSTRLLEWQPIRWLGRISYSLYLWHVLFFFRVDTAAKVTSPVLLALSGRPVKLFASLAVATLSYYLIEKPCMRLGHRLAPPATPGRPELAESQPVELSNCTL